MSALLSGSGLTRAHRCPAAFALPAVTEPASQECSDGIEGHWFLQRIANGMHLDDALRRAPEHLRAFFATIDRTKVPQAPAEVAFAYDVISGQVRLLYHTEHRRYEVLETEIPGTADLIAWSTIGQSLRVIDWKFPSYDHDVETSWPQLEFYALAASILYGVGEVRIELGIVNDDGSIGFHERVLDWEDLARIASEVTATWARVIEVRAEREAHEADHTGPWTPDVTTGPHCQYCPAFVHCPGKRAAVAAFLGAVPEVLTPDDAGKAYAAYKAAERLGGEVHGVVKTLLDTHGELETGDGQVVRFTRNRSVRISRAKEVDHAR